MSIRLNNMRRMAAVCGLLVVFVLMLVAPSASAQAGLQITIPTLGVDSHISEFPLNGVSWTINPWESGIGHLQGTGWFGSVGNTALGGHSWLPNRTPGIFVNLHTLQPGQEIIINADGQEMRYTVTGVSNVSMYDLSVIYPTGDEQLTLITCDAGSFDPSSNLYNRRVIVRAARTG